VVPSDGSVINVGSTPDGSALRHFHGLAHPLVGTFESRRSHLQPAITRICRQHRRETLPLFYSLNTFVVDIECTWSRTSSATAYIDGASPGVVEGHRLSQRGRYLKNLCKWAPPERKWVRQVFRSNAEGREHQCGRWCGHIRGKEALVAVSHALIMGCGKHGKLGQWGMAVVVNSHYQ